MKSILFYKDIYHFRISHENQDIMLTMMNFLFEFVLIESVMLYKLLILEYINKSVEYQYYIHLFKVNLIQKQRFANDILNFLVT
jgi:hypothetical protein